MSLHRFLLSVSRKYVSSSSIMSIQMETMPMRLVCSQVRFLTRIIQPTEEDLNPVVELNDLNTYEEIISRYNNLKSQAIAGGGARGHERHVQKNKKMLVRDRIMKIIDPDTEFFELGTFAGFNMPYVDMPMAGVLAGFGRVGGVYCLISGNDATIKGGTLYPISLQKSLRLQEISLLNRLPYIYIPDSGGAFLPLQSQIFVHGGRIFYNQAIISSKGIPQIAIVCGSCTAGGAYNPTMSDEAIIVDRIGKIFLGGPPLVKAALGEIVSDEELGGAFMHSSVSGCTDYYAQNEEEAFLMCREIVETLNYINVQLSLPFKEPAYQFSSWKNLACHKHLTKGELYALLGSVLDGSVFKEFKAFYGVGLITGIGYIEGSIVGIVTNSDEIFSEEALKGTHFLDMCGRRQIPVLFLQNSFRKKFNPINFDSEIIKNRGKLCASIGTLNVPKISLTLTGCHQDDHFILCGPSFNPNFSYMWPLSEISYPDMGFVDLNSEEDGILDAFTAAANMLVDEVIPPEKTRKVIGESLRIIHQIKLINFQEVSQKPIFRM